MPLDPLYIDAIRNSEGFTPQAQWDYKQNSNGYGTRALYPGEVIDKDTAEQRFQTELDKAQAHVETVAPNAPPGVKAALTSLTYNAGPGWSQSGLGDLVRAGDWTGAAERFQQYNKAGGQVNQGLVNRRGKEAAWFNQAPTGESIPAQAASVPPMQIAPMGGAPRPMQTQASAPLDLNSFRQAAYSAPPSMPAFPWSPGQQQPGQPAQQYDPMAMPQMPQAPPINYFRPQAHAPLRRGFLRG
jgi:lysozyme